MNTLIQKHGYSFLLLFIVACIGWWPVFNGNNPLSHDQTIAFYPWRYFIGECLKEGIFPYWNPYQTFGYPIHADPQAGAWYLPVWILGINGYSVFDLNMEFSMHILLSGIGMYFFSGLFLQRSDLRIISGIAYMCSGFMIANAQHLSWIIAAAWLPWVPYCWYRYLKQGTVLHLLSGICSLGLLLTGGYPMFVIMLAYGLLILSLYFFIRKKNIIRISSYQFFTRSLLFALPALLMASGTLFSMVLAFPSFSRVKGVDLDACLHGSFSIKAWSSFFYPFPSRYFPDFYGNDPSMCNAYISGFLFALLPLTLFLKRNKTGIILMLGVVFFLMLGAGQDFSLRTWFYTYIPLFKVSRFPALFRSFALLMAIPASCLVIEELFCSNRISKKVIVAFILSFCLLLILFLLVLQTGTIKSFQLQAIFKSIGNLAAEKNFGLLTYSNLLIQLIIFPLYLTVLIFINSVRMRISWLTLILVGDLVIMTHSNGPVSSWSRVNENKDLNTFITSLPKDFPVPALSDLNHYNDSTGFYGVLWRNLNNYWKKPGWDGFSSSFFPGAYTLFDSCSSTFRRYRSERNWLTWFPKTNQKIPLSGNWCLNELGKSRFRIEENLYVTNETSSKSAIVLPVQFQPNSIRIKVNSTQPGFLMLAQNKYPGWHAYLNKKETTLLQADGYFIATAVPSGISEIEFRYRHTGLTFALQVQILSSLLVVGAMLYLLLFGKSNE